MIGTLYLPERTTNLQDDYDTLLGILRAWHRTANELDNQVHALQKVVDLQSGQIKLLQRRVHEFEKEKKTCG